jgi:DNA topoisomerase IA
MGLKLNKPYLRAAMEADCQKIMRGEVQRNDVVMACLNEMKARFLQAVSQASKLDDAVSKVTFFCFFLYSSFLFI